jgi:hypothetical protein
MTPDSMLAQARPVASRATARPPLADVAVYAIIVGATLLIALNPVVTAFAIHLGGFHKLYLLCVDACLVAIIGAAFLYLRTGRRLYFRLGVVALCLTPLLLCVAELAISYGVLRYGAEIGGRKVTGVYEPDPKLGWRLVANGSGRHVSPGNFDVTYETDARGRRTVPAATVAGPTVHFFGSSFTFGDGVKNDETALYILAQANRDRFRVINYSVSAYGLDQMVYDLEINRDAIAPGDVVVLAPTPMSLSWNMIDASFPCLYTVRNDEYPVGLYPQLTAKGWEFVDLKASCRLIETLLYNSPSLPLGNFFLPRHVAAARPASLAHADLLFARVRQVAEARGARFLPIMVVNTDECLTRKFMYDLTGLKSPIVSMLPYCPADPAALEGMRFPDDWHYTVKGNRWLAGVLDKMLRSEEPSLR